jgi:hypothetical protein
MYLSLQLRKVFAASCSTAFMIKEPENQTQYPLLQQHFIGWFIKSKEAVFNPETATFMDFLVAQKEIHVLCMFYLLHQPL